jgi:hypothetical protein
MTDILSKKLNFPCWYPSVTGKIHVAWYKNIKPFYRKLNTSNILILLLLMLPLRQMALSDGMHELHMAATGRCIIYRAMQS